MNPIIQTILAQFDDLIEDAKNETGVELKETKEAIVGYMHERTTYLAGASTEPGFAKAVRAERNNVAMFAGLQTGEATDAGHERFVGLIGGALRIAASLMLTV